MHEAQSEIERCKCEQVALQEQQADADSKLDRLAEQLIEADAKQRDLDKRRAGILKAKNEHLRELFEKDLHSLQLTYGAQIDKKEELER